MRVRKAEDLLPYEPRLMNGLRQIVPGAELEKMRDIQKHGWIYSMFVTRNGREYGVDDRWSDTEGYMDFEKRFLAKVEERFARVPQLAEGSGLNP